MGTVILWYMGVRQYLDIVSCELCQESCWRLPPAESAPPLCTSASGQGTVYNHLLTITITITSGRGTRG